MGEVLIRPGEENDLPALAEIISSSEAWTRYGINYNIALGLFEKMEDTIYVGEIDGTIAGFFTLRTNGVGNIGAYLRMIAVAEPYRGWGIGTQLINRAADLAFQAIPNLFLICSTDNAGAQNFYEKTGFTKAGVLTDLVVPGHDEILYRKNAGTLR